MRGVVEITVGEQAVLPGTASTAPAGTVDTSSAPPLSVETYLGSELTKDTPEVTDREVRIRTLIVSLPGFVVRHNRLSV